jgi:hypothetical protein
MCFWEYIYVPKDQKRALEAIWDGFLEEDMLVVLGKIVETADLLMMAAASGNEACGG